MPENEVSDPITDQEIAFALLVLSGAMTDRQAAEAVGLNPDSATNTRAKPRVRAYMLEHPAAMQQQLVQQEADLSRLPRRAVGRDVGPAVDGLRRLSPDREQVLNRLWEIANLSPDMTRGSVTGQVKALSIIVAMENFIPDRRALSSEKKSAPNAQISAEWLRRQQATIPAQQEDEPACPSSAAEAPADPTELSSRLPQRAVGPAAEPDRPVISPGPSRSTFAHLFTPVEVPEPYVPLFASVPNTRAGFSIKKNPFRPR